MAEGHAMQALQDLRDALDQTEHLFNSSDARLYTPNTEDINDCTYKLMECFLMEMNVLLHDEDSKDFKDNQPMIKAALENYRGTHCKKTDYCEQELTNPMVFFERMKTFLQKLSTVCHGKGKVPCD